MIYCILNLCCYISDKQCKNNKYWFSWQNLKVYFFQLGMTFHGMGQSRLDVRKYYFSQRTVNEWNKFSADCLHSSSINMFKNSINNHLIRAG